jgi:tetratricopeptide (TPR) repeat protein
MQQDGTLHEEDSYERYYPVRNEAGRFAGIADVATIVTGAIFAAAEDRSDRAAAILDLVEGDPSMRVAVANSVVDLLGGDPRAAERSIRQHAERFGSEQVETEINDVGYALMQTGKFEHAHTVLALNTRIFPAAYNTWDSLGEVLMNLGRNEEAIAAYERSLELNPDNTNARHMIARIRGGGGE